MTPSSLFATPTPTILVTSSFTVMPTEIPTSDDNDDDDDDDNDDDDNDVDVDDVDDNDNHDNDDNDDDDDGLSVGAIIGIVIGGLTFLLIAILIFVGVAKM